MNDNEKEVYDNLEKEVISKFLDSKSGKDSPFSIKEITQIGNDLFQKIAGDWYGTNSISQVLKELNNKYKPYQDIEVCVFNDGIFFKSDIIELGTEVFDPAEHPTPFDADSGSGSSSEVENVATENYFEQTRRDNGQSGGSEDFKGRSCEHKSKHSGGGSQSKPCSSDKKSVSNGCMVF